MISTTIAAALLVRLSKPGSYVLLTEVELGLTSNLSLLLLVLLDRLLLSSSSNGFSRTVWISDKSDDYYCTYYRIRLLITVSIRTIISLCRHIRQQK